MVQQTMLARYPGASLVCLTMNVAGPVKVTPAIERAFAWGMDSLRAVLAGNRVLTWEEAGSFRIGQYILMHSAIYRTAMLRECGMTLPKHTFYVDNLYVYMPLPSVQKMVYLDLPLYHYFIGREDQSVHEEVIVKVIDFAIETGFFVKNLEYSPIKGPEGNIEYLVYIRKEACGGREESVDIRSVVDAAHGELDK